MRKYTSAAQARADELLDLLDEDELDAAQALLMAEVGRDGDSDLIRFIVALSGPIETILEQTPAKDRAWKKKTDRNLFLRQWLAARYWAIAAANALSLAEELENVPGLGYRMAGRAAAQAASRWMDQPDLWDLCSRRLF